MGSRPGLSCDIHLNSALSEEDRRIYQNQEVITRILSEADTVAVYGLSSRSHKASQFVASYLQYEGYRIIPINPYADEILGNESYPDLLSVEEDVDVVDIFRPPGECSDIVEQAIEKNVSAVWLQLKIINLDAGRRARHAGLDVVMDKCMKMEHGRYSGGLHSMGMNTELITARRGVRIR
jgi:predicted CoA-binding protein